MAKADWNKTVRKCVEAGLNCSDDIAWAAENIAEDEKTPDINAIIGGAFETLGGCRICQGMAEILNGRLDHGWSLFSWGWEVASWGHTVRAAVFNRIVEISPNLAKVAQFLVGSIALNRPQFGAESFKWVNAGLEHHKLRTYWNGHYPPFALRLFSLWRGPKPSSKAKSMDLGPYQDVFDNWEDQQGLTKALEGICSYHVHHCLTDTTKDDFYGPHNYFPAEIVALRRVRAEKGLDTPKVSHRLLDNALSEVPGQIEPFKEQEFKALLNKGLACVRRKMPELRDFLPERV